VNRKLNTHTSASRGCIFLALCSFQGPPRRTHGVSVGGLSKLSSDSPAKADEESGRRSREISLERR